MSTSDTSIAPQEIATWSISQKAVILLGRLCLAFIFLLVGPNLFTNAAITDSVAAGIPLASIATPLAGLLSLLSGLSVLLGYRAKIGAWLMVVFLVAVTPTMHKFWGVSDSKIAQLQMIMFLKNLSILGGAFLMTQFGAGPWSIDSRRHN